MRENVSAVSHVDSSGSGLKVPESTLILGAVYQALNEVETREDKWMQNSENLFICWIQTSQCHSHYEYIADFGIKHYFHGLHFLLLWWWKWPLGWNLSSTPIHRFSNRKYGNTLIPLSSSGHLFAIVIRTIFVCWQAETHRTIYVLELALSRHSFLAIHDLIVIFVTLSGRNSLRKNVDSPHELEAIE